MMMAARVRDVRRIIVDKSSKNFVFIISSLVC